MRKKVPDYLLRMIDDYLSDKWVIYQGDKWSLKEEVTCGAEEVTCGAPQVSRVGPLVCNVMYDDFLRMDLPAGTSIIGLADDALVVCAADDVRILELRINESLWRAKRWLVNNHAIQKKLFSAQRGVVLRIVSAYRTLSTSAVLVLTSVPPIDLLAEERKEIF